jgi:serine/threonine-protein kinase
MSTPSPDADRNLLFGILAVQNEFVSRDQLVEAMNAWVLTKQRPLGDILRERGALAEQHHALLSALVDMQLNKHGGDAWKSLAALSSAESAKRLFATIADDDVQASLRHVGYRAAEATTDATPPTTTRYQILRPHARGGLGEVFVANDTELHREVALKEIQLRHADDAQSRGRFVLEAEITGGLEHPGIVPVYGLGTYGDGRPFYAMKFIRGDSLKEAIERFHRRSSESSVVDFSGSEFRQLLRRFTDVCNAIAYAHARGVLHRDLKPGNVMLGKFGETLVVDWGLAKVCGRSSPAGRAINGGTEATLRPVSGRDLAETVAGSAVGTPAYMSPEQAGGRIDELGPATDIYSLGATLYCLLTGRAPVEGADTGEVLRKVQRGEVGFDQGERRGESPPVGPNQIQRDWQGDGSSTGGLTPRRSPAPLVAITRKAMSLLPADRYPSALALAADIDRWLADEPVSAYREPWTVRAGRWLRRHRTLTTSVAAAVGVAALSLGVLAVRLNAEQRRTEQSLTFARSSLDDMTALVIDDLLGRQIQLTQEHKRYLQKALEVYERFAQDTGADERSRNGVAGAYLRVGDIRQRLGEYQDAEAAYQKATDLFQQLATDFPATAEHRRNVANSQNNLGVLLQRQGRYQEAEAAHRRAIELQEPVATLPGSVAKSRQELARSYLNLGSPLQSLAKHAEAEDAYRHAWDLQEQLMTEFPEEAGYRPDFAANGNNLAVVLNTLGKGADAEAVYRRVADIQEKLVADFPTVSEYRQQLARTHNNLGILLQALRRYGNADAEYRRAIELREQLAADFPSVPEHRQNLAHSYYNLGVSLQDQGKFAQAEEPLRVASGLREKLSTQFPRVPEYRHDLAFSYNSLGLLLRSQGKRPEAEAELKHARDINEKLAEEYPKIAEHRQGLAHNYFNLALVLQDVGRLSDAAAAFRQADACLAQLTADSPNVLSYRAELAKTDYGMGLLLRDQGNCAEAEKVLARALALYEKLADDNPNVSLFRQEVGGLCINLAALCLKQDRAADAVAWYAKSIARLKPIVEREPKLALERRYLGLSFSGRAQALNKLGRFADALSDWEQALQFNQTPADQTGLRLGRAMSLARAGQHAAAVAETNTLAEVKDAGSSTLYALACVCAVASATVQDTMLREQYAVRSVELLEQAIVKGYKDIEHLKKNDDLKALREREDYQKLVKKLEGAK